MNQITDDNIVKMLQNRFDDGNLVEIEGESMFDCGCCKTYGVIYCNDCVLEHYCDMCENFFMEKCYYPKVDVDYGISYESGEWIIYDEEEFDTLNCYCNKCESEHIKRGKDVFFSD